MEGDSCCKLAADGLDMEVKSEIVTAVVFDTPGNGLASECRAAWGLA